MCQTFNIQESKPQRLLPLNQVRFKTEFLRTRQSLTGFGFNVTWVTKFVLGNITLRRMMMMMMMNLCKSLQAPSVWFQFSMWGLRVSGNTTCSLPVIHKFHPIMHLLSMWGPGTPRNPAVRRGKSKSSLLVRLCQHGPPSHSLSRSL